MKVKELIKELQPFDENQDVYLQQLTDHGGQYSVASDGVLEQEAIDICSKTTSNIVVITIDNKTYELTDE